LDQFRFPWIDRGQFLERLMQVQEVVVGRVDKRQVVAERHPDRWAAYASTSTARPRSSCLESCVRRTTPISLDTLLGLGTVHRLQVGWTKRSARCGRRGRLLRRTLSSRDRVAGVAGELGPTLRALGRTTEAESLLNESHDIFHAAFGDAHPPTKQALARMHGDQ